MANIYVIELEREVMNVRRFREANPDHDETKPCIYVGMTQRTPEERFHQHKRGYKSSRYPRGFGIRLRPRLYEHHNPMSYEQACMMEFEIARRLRNRGYAVWQN